MQCVIWQLILGMGSSVRPHGELSPFYFPREKTMRSAIQAACYKVKARSHTVNTLLTGMPGAPNLST